MNSGGTRAVAMWHRRAGKDQVALHWLSVASQRRVGVYWYCLPTHIQARRVLWENIDGAGNRVLDAFPGWRNPDAPGSIVAHVRHDMMRLELRNGSAVYAIGADAYDSLMGTNPVGVVMSEYAIANPAAYQYVSPILAENGGWAVFPFTPRGNNHGYRLYEMARDNPDWFCEKLTVDDTHAITPEQIDAERRAGMPEEIIQQEYYCSADAPLVGSFWGDQMIDCDKDGRITRVPYDEALPVHTWWDLGNADATAIWFVQIAGMEIHFIDYDEASYRTPAQDVAVLHSKREAGGWVYGRHIWPHDGGHRTKASGGRSLAELYGDLGIFPEVQRAFDVQVAVTRVRQILPRCWFDETKCAAGIDALRAFRKQLDEEKSSESRPYYRPGYVHDWCLAAGTQVLTPDGWREVQNISVHDQVLTPCGARRIIRSGIVRRTMEWVTVRGIRCTPEHRFFTSRGLVEAGELSLQEKFWTRDSWGLTILAFLSVIFRSGFKAAIISATPERAAGRTVRCSFTGWSTRLCTAKYRQVMKSITSMITRLITTPVILRPFLASNTAAATSRNLGICALAVSVGRSSAVISGSARGVTRPVGASTTREPSASAEPAYNLTVEADECYFVLGSDGRAYLVSNSSHGSSAFYTGAMVAFDPHSATRTDRYSGVKRKKSAWGA